MELDLLSAVTHLKDKKVNTLMLLEHLYLFSRYWNAYFRNFLFKSINGWPLKASGLDSQYLV